MVCLTVMYPTAGATKFNWDYYLGKHLQLSRKLLGSRGLQRLEVTRGVGGFPPGAPAPYHAIANLYFDSLPTLQSALMATAEELIADVPNYYAGQSEVQIAEVVES